MYNRIRSTVDSLQGRRAGISPSVDAFIRRHGDEPITLFTISRTVLNPLLTGAIGVISPSKRYQVTSSTRIDTHYKNKSVARKELEDYHRQLSKAERLGRYACLDSIRTHPKQDARHNTFEYGWSVYVLFSP
jgi:hypothetical protein